MATALLEMDGRHMVSKRRMMGTFASCGVAAAAMASAGQARAATAPYSTGFESPPFTQGAYLTNQGGFTSSVTTDVTSGSGAAVVATYQGTGITPTASGGAQYVQINDFSGIAPTTFATYFPNLTSITPVAQGTPIVNVVGQIGVTPGAATSAATGAVFGLDAFDGTGSQTQIADLAVNAFSGAVTLNNGSTITGFTAPAGTFTQYQLQLNYLTGSYSAFATNLTTNVTTFLGSANFEAAATTFSSAGFDTFSRGTGTAYGLGLVDNLAITTAVPEPASASLILGGLAFAGSRRRRRTVAR